MKIAIYSPYLDSLGGGERYMMSIAEYLADHGNVNVFWDDKALKSELQSRFNLNLTNVQFVPNVFQKNMIAKYQALKGYDLLVYLSDGSFPFGFAKKNILHLQMPFTFSYGKSFLNQMKLKSWQTVIVNSAFTKQAIDKTFGVTSTVVYPPVDVRAFQPGTKEDCIVSVGRMRIEERGKRHLLLIEAFQKLLVKHPNWRLIIAGSIENRAYYEELVRAAKNLPIEIAGNATFDSIVAFYQKAKIYWHAQGFDETEPQYFEHFGIATVEAMAAGCVPIVFNGGGQKEIVKPNESGFLWQTTNELLDLTEQLILNQDRWATLSHGAIARSRAFSKEQFHHALHSLLL